MANIKACTIELDDGRRFVAIKSRCKDACSRCSLKDEFRIDQCIHLCYGVEELIQAKARFKEVK